MSNQVSIVESLMALEKPFTSQNAYALKFENECLFARQQLSKNSSAMDTAQRNEASLRGAILNVAAIGVSLNPALAHAYLVPRDGGICLDISYKGLVKLATDSGAINWAKPELVYDDETFEWENMTVLPIHKMNPFGGKRATGGIDGLIGGYCIAQLRDGSYLIDHMSLSDIENVHSTSKAKNGPWKNWPLEMIKKTLVKRASKSWPQSGGRERLDLAIEVLNEHEGLAAEPTVARASNYMRPTPEQTGTYLELAKGDAIRFHLWIEAQDERVKTFLPGCDFERGQKGAMMTYYNTHKESGRERFATYSADLFGMCESGDEYGIRELLLDFDDDIQDALLDSLPMQHQAFAKPLAQMAA
jgi:recombination protein RecT